MNQDPLRPKKIVCLVNPYAANKKWLRRRKLREKIKEMLPGRIYEEPSDRERMIELVKKLSAEHDLLLALGGDGTIADVIQGIRQAPETKETVLGIIPFGSGNAFRKSLGIPKNPRKALRLLAAGEIREIDLIDMEGRTAGFVSIGATAGVTLEKIQHEVPGLAGHLLAAWRMFSLPVSEKEIELWEGLDDRGVPFEKKCLKLRFLDCVIAKTNFFGYSWRVAPKARLDDGYLDVTFFEISPLQFLLLFPLIYFGVFQKTQKHFKAKRILIRGKDLPVQYNGEVLGVRDIIEFKILPRALKILCP
jgi:diacylglycerol kinase family enzyme